MLQFFLIVFHITDLGTANFDNLLSSVDLSHIKNKLTVCQMFKVKIISINKIKCMLDIIYTCTKRAHSSYSNKVFRMLSSQNKTLPLFQELTKHGGNPQTQCSCYN